MQVIGHHNPGDGRSHRQFVRSIDFVSDDFAEFLVRKNRLTMLAGGRYCVCPTRLGDPILAQRIIVVSPESHITILEQQFAVMKWYFRAIRG